MHLLVILVTKNNSLLKTFIRQQDAIKKDCITCLNSAVDLVFTSALSEDDLCDLPLHHHLNYGSDSGIIVIYDDALSTFIESTKIALFSYPIGDVAFVPNMCSFLINEIRRAVKNYLSIKSAAAKLNNYQALALPLKNFDSQCVHTLINVCTSKTSSKSFQDDLNHALSCLLRLKGPKRRSRFPEMYFIDDKKLYFQYGQERHSSYETNYPHNKLCHLNGIYRFGIYLEQQRHFNVSTDTKFFSCTSWFDCHNQHICVTKQDHINMFSNGFFKSK